MTLVLCESELHDDTSRGSVQNIADAHASALLQFVTGFTDIEQTKEHKQSMFKVAQSIGLPRSFVELRHRITHEDIPPLQTLRDANERARQWLLEKYWIPMSNEYAKTKRKEPECVSAKTLEKLIWIFTSIVKGYSDLSMTARCEPKQLEKQVKAIVQLVEKHCDNHSLKLLAFSQVLLDSGNLSSVKVLAIDAPQELASLGSVENLEGIIKQRYCWDRLLQRIAELQSNFLETLTGGLLTAIMDEGRLDDTSNETKRSLLDWMLWIISSPFWKDSIERSTIQLSALAHTCLANPGPYTLKAAQFIIETRPELEDSKRALWMKMITNVTDDYRALQNAEIEAPQCNAANIKHDVPTRLIDGRDIWLPAPIGVPCIKLNAANPKDFPGSQEEL